MWTPLLNSASSNYSRYQISAYTDNFDILDQIYPKKDIAGQKSSRWISPVNFAYSD